MSRCLLSLLLSWLSAFAYAADSLTVARVNPQGEFPATVPAGNYSGITYLGDDRYAVVSDKSEDGFFIFVIRLDSVTGQIRDVVNEGFFASGYPNRDQEGITYVPSLNTLFICGEKDNEVLEYRMDGTRTGRRLAMPGHFSTALRNYGLEALTYHSDTRLFWTTTESTLPQDGEQATPENPVRNRLRLQAFDERLLPVDEYFYEMDEPTAEYEAANYAMGVSALAALADGQLLVLEREFYVSPGKIGSFVNCKLYVVSPDSARGTKGTPLSKRLLYEFRTSLSLFSYSIANYEGMCLGPRLSDGSQVLLLVSDSQNQYGEVLKDWFMTIKLK